MSLRSEVEAEREGLKVARVLQESPPGSKVKEQHEEKEVEDEEEEEEVAAFTTASSVCVSFTRSFGLLLLLQSDSARLAFASLNPPAPCTTSNTKTHTATQQ